MNTTDLIFCIREETITYKGKELTVLFESWLDTKTGETTTTDEQDNINLDQILEQYNKIMENEQLENNNQERK